MNHLPGRGMGPLSLIDLVSKDHWQIERSCNVYGPKHPWSTINRKMNSSRIGLSPKGHSVVELDDHPRVEKPTWGHKWLQGVPLYYPHRVDELWICSKGWKIIINFVMRVLGTKIRIFGNRVAVEEGSPDDRSRGHIQREISSKALSRW